MSGYRSKRVANTRTAMGTTDQRPTGSGSVMLGLTGSGPGSSRWTRRAAQRRGYTSMLQKKCAEGNKASCINPVPAAAPAAAPAATPTLQQIQHRNFVPPIHIDGSLPIYTMELDTYFTPYTNGTVSSPPQWYNELGLSSYPWYHFLPPLANNFTEYVNEPFVLQIKVSNAEYMFSPGSAGTDARVFLYALYNGTSFGSLNSTTQPYWDNHVNQINNIKAVYFDDSMLGTTSPNFTDGLTRYVTEKLMFRYAGGENLRVIRLPAGLNPYDGGSSNEVFPYEGGTNILKKGQTRFFFNQRNGNLKFLFYGSRIFVNSSTESTQGNRSGTGNVETQNWDNEGWGENREDGGNMKDFTLNQIASANDLLNLQHDATAAEITAAENAISN